MNIEKGDIVYHKSNPNIRFVAMQPKETIVTCRNVNEKGNLKQKEFYIFELCIYQ